MKDTASAPSYDFGSSSTAGGADPEGAWHSPLGLGGDRGAKYVARRPADAHPDGSPIGLRADVWDNAPGEGARTWRNRLANGVSKVGPLSRE